MKNHRFYVIVGSQHLYGNEVLKQVDENGKMIADHINKDQRNPSQIIWKNTVKSKQEIIEAVKQANDDDLCAGVIVWMHTFSPAKMWIEGLNRLNKPLLHLHTQTNAKIPFQEIDMDFMNLNQSAHGDREFGHLTARLRMNHEVITGHFEDDEVKREIFIWMRAASGVLFSHTLNVLRIGDNMRYVSVTEGDKVSAETKFGWAVNTYGVGDFVVYVDKVHPQEVNELFERFQSMYEIISDQHDNIKEQIKYEIALKRMLDDHQAKAVTTTFEDLHGLKQLPGLAIQRLMAQGYGFGGEGDWKVSAMTAILKYMSEGLEGATSFMEDYTYHFESKNTFVLGAHMLEICPTLAKGKIKIDVQPLGIGGKDAPARMLFKAGMGPALVTSIVDLGDRFRMIVNVVDLIEGPDMPKLPVAQVLWKPVPNLKTAATAWIYAGGSHHTVLTTSLEVDHLRHFAQMMNIECVIIDENTNITTFRKELALNDVIYRFQK